MSFFFIRCFASEGSFAEENCIYEKNLEGALTSQKKHFSLRAWIQFFLRDWLGHVCHKLNFPRKKKRKIETYFEQKVSVQ